MLISLSARWRRFAALMALVLSLSLLAACGDSTATTASTTTLKATTTAAAATTTAAPPQAVTTTAATTASATKKGGIARVALYQEPSTLNPLFSTSTVTDMVSGIFLEALVGISPDGNYFPNLVTEVPTLANGGVSADSLTITYKLKKDVKWSNGKPFTAKDVVFTYKLIMDDKNDASQSGYSQMASVEAKDDSTVVVKYKSIDAAYLYRWGSILPENVFNGNTDISKADFNRAPIGTGPFIVKSWKAGESLTLERNPNYRDPNKPYLDGLIFKITPSREAAIQAFQANEVDAIWDLTEAQIPAFEKFTDTVLEATPSMSTERLILNLSQPNGDKAGDPSTTHPILGDLKVRQAIQYAINKKSIAEKLLYGKTTVATSVIPTGWAATKQPESEFSVEKAKAKLDEAGWKPGSDGIRVKDGLRMKLEFGTTSGNKTRELTQQLIQEQLKAVGIEVEIKNVPSEVLFAGWADNGARAHGTYDILMWTTEPGVDPDNHMFNYFHSSRIPTAANKGAGRNYSRWKNPDVDKALDEAAATVDPEKRKAAYTVAVQKINEELPQILLYNRLELSAYKKTVGGHSPNIWVGMCWNTHDWFLNK